MTTDVKPPKKEEPVADGIENSDVLPGGLRPVTVEPIPFDAVDDGPRKRYWVGTTEDCPRQNVTLGGVCFPRFSGIPTFGERGESDSEMKWGVVLELTEAQVDLATESIRHRAVRFMGATRRATLLVTTRKGYRATSFDRQLGQFVYMIELPGDEPPPRHKFPPPTLMPREKLPSELAATG